MLKSKLRIFLNTLTFIVLFSSSCFPRTENKVRPTVNSSLVDTSWFTGKPCSVPCWYGLQPGGSTKDEVLSKSRELYFLKPGQVLEGMVWDNYPTLSFECSDPLNYACVYMVFRDDILYMLQISPAIDVTFAEIVEKYGNPDGFTVNRKNPEGKGCTVSLFWKNRLTEVVNRDLDNVSIYKDDLCDRVQKSDNRVPSELTVQSVVIMDESLLTDKSGNNNLIHWNGFISDN